MNVIDYIREEVTRQGHDVTVLDGIRRVGWMLNAWEYALNRVQLGFSIPTVTDAIEIGKLVERNKNKFGIRECDVYVGWRSCPDPRHINRLLVALFESQSGYSPIEFYKEFELIHPFEDGNGRTGKVILNWLNGTLYDPIFPPSDLFGESIRNP